VVAVDGDDDVPRGDFGLDHLTGLGTAATATTTTAVAVRAGSAGTAACTVVGVLIVRSDIDVDPQPVLDVGDAAAALADDARDVVFFHVDDSLVLALEFDVDVAVGDRADLPFDLLFGDAVDTGLVRRAAVLVFQWDGDDLPVEGVNLVLGSPVWKFVI